MKFNRTRFQQRKQHRQHTQAQHEQNALLACEVLKLGRVSAKVEDGVIIIFAEPQLVDLLYCMSYSFMTQPDQSIPPQFAKLFQIATHDEQDGLRQLFEAIWLSRFWLRGYDRTIKRYQRGEIVIMQKLEEATQL